MEEDEIEEGVGDDLDDVLCDIGERLESIEKKLDMLLSQRQSSSAPSREFSPARREARDGFSRDRGDSFAPKRELTRVQCAKCGNACEVPFRPTGDRPVYCRDCFGKNQDRTPSREGHGGKRSSSGFRPRKNKY
jgi:CxxC-x17-CxxC domain-containing protein